MARKARLDITENTLSSTDISLVLSTLMIQQAKLSRVYIPAPVLFENLKTNLSQELDVNQFRTALSLALEAGRFPGMKNQLGKVGGFGPISSSSTSKKEEKKEINEVNLSDEEVNADENNIENNIEDDIGEDEINSVNEINDIVPPLDLNELQEVAQKITEEKVEITPEREVEKKSASVILLPVKPGDWNPNRAEEFILGFAELANVKEKVLLRNRAKECALTENQTRAIFRVALGFDPGMKQNSFLDWNKCFEPQVVEVLNKVVNENVEEAPEEIIEVINEVIEASEITETIEAEATGIKETSGVTEVIEIEKAA